MVKKALPWHLPGGTEKTHGNLSQDSCYPAELRTKELQNISLFGLNVILQLHVSKYSRMYQDIMQEINIDSRNNKLKTYLQDIVNTYIVFCAANIWCSIKQRSANFMHLLHHVAYFGLFGHNQATYINCCTTVALASVYIFGVWSRDF
jgi:hypothetical protein